MGQSIFRHLYNYDFNLLWVNLSNHEEECDKITRRLNRYLKKNIISKEEYDKKKNSIIISNTLEEIHNCDLIIETVNEDIHIKNSLFDDLDIKANPQSIIVSNSSSILPSRFDITNKIKQNFAGLHFFYPVETNKLLEIIPQEETTESTISRLLEFSKSISKTPFLQNSTNAFGINRFFLEIQSGLFNSCTENNIPFSKADQAIKNKLFPIGIFETMDIIGFRIMEYSLSNYINQHDNPKQIYPILEFIRSQIKEGKMGLINNAGFLSYPLENVTISDSETTEIVDFVKLLLSKTSDQYLDKGIFKNKNEIEFIISEFTSSDFEF